MCLQGHLRWTARPTRGGSERAQNQFAFQLEGYQKEEQSHAAIVDPARNERVSSTEPSSRRAAAPNEHVCIRPGGSMSRVREALDI